MTAKSAKQANRRSRLRRFETSTEYARRVDPVNPDHYQRDYVMRVIEDFGCNFLDGQVLKYILRAGRKPNTPSLEDYKKALWYLQQKIANLERTLSQRK